MLAFALLKAVLAGLAADLGPRPYRAGSIEAVRIDPARDSWRALLLVPGLGEARAKRLTAAWLRRGGLDRRALRAVPGIGLGLAQRLERALAFPKPAGDHARAPARIPPHEPAAGPRAAPGGERTRGGPR